MQIVKYNIDRNILTVGFKVDNFVVYSSIPFDETKSKNELLQSAYKQVKKTIEYEKTQTEHAFVTDEEGELFVPEEPRPEKVTILCADAVHFASFDEQAEVELRAEVIDQYGDKYNGLVNWASTFGTVEGARLLIPKIVKEMEITVTAELDGVTAEKVVCVYPYVEPSIVDEPIDDETVAIAEAVVDLNARLSVLEGGNR